ncbi:hypothetical protein HAX54_006315, partial [Datura stramonium]|nr:hypothetical protein [Datura stramonium]
KWHQNEQDQGDEYDDSREEYYLLLIEQPPHRGPTLSHAKLKTCSISAAHPRAILALPKLRSQSLEGPITNVMAQPL